MNTDINKQIEEEARKILFKANKLPPEANYFGSVDHIKYSSNEILKLSEELELSSRWRKVSEELPEFTDKFRTINVKSRKGNISTMNIHSRFKDVFHKEIKQFSIIEWKPID